jgi:hypothetical protein
VRTDPVTTPSPTVKGLAIAAILGVGLIHLLEARDAFGDATYKGSCARASSLSSL